MSLVIPRPLDPRYLTTAASLNRAPLVSVPGASPEEGVLGKRAYDLLSSRYVFEQICAHAPALHIPPDVLVEGRAEPFVRLDRCFESDLGSVRGAAITIARRYGRHMGWLLLMLRRADPPNRAARPDWGDDYWAHWQQVARVHLAGGLIRGHLRDFLLEEIATVFQAAHTPPPDLLLDPHGAYLPLIGGALCVPRGHQTALVLDFGGTNIKRGQATYDAAGDLIEMRPLLPLLTDYAAYTVPAEALEDALLSAYAQRMIQIIADAWQSVQPDCPIIPVVIAAYVDPDGNPRDGSLFSLLKRVTGPLQAALTAGVSAATSAACQIKLLHDGTAAATVYPGDAVITLGTAIGVGLAPAVESPLALAAGFRLAPAP